MKNRLIHQQKFEAKQHDETHDSVGDYVKSMIFGGLDGILTSFAIVAGAAGGRLPVQVRFQFSSNCVLRPPFP